jgi:hypothetical protein
MRGQARITEVGLLGEDEDRTPLWSTSPLEHVSTREVLSRSGPSREEAGLAGRLGLGRWPWWRWWRLGSFSVLWRGGVWSNSQVLPLRQHQLVTGTSTSTSTSNDTTTVVTVVVAVNSTSSTDTLHHHHLVVEASLPVVARSLAGAPGVRSSQHCRGRGWVGGVVTVVVLVLVVLFVVTRSPLSPFSPQETTVTVKGGFRGVVVVLNIKRDHFSGKDNAQDQ